MSSTETDPVDHMQEWSAPPLDGASAGTLDGELLRSRPLSGLVVDAGCAALFSQFIGNLLDAPTTTLDVARQLSTEGTSSLLSAGAVLFGARTEAGLPSHEGIEQLRARAPHVGIYIIACTPAEIGGWMPLYAVAGVDDVLYLSAPAPARAMAAMLRQRLTAPPPETEIRLLWRWFRESPERSLILHCVRNAFAVDDWVRRARIFSASRKTLQNRVSSLGLPSPGKLARCGRLMHAQELERRGVKPTRIVARALEFPSATALQRARRRLRHSLLTSGRQAAVFASLLR